MIAYEELVAALDRWRARNGLPIASTDLPPAAELPRQPLPALSPDGSRTVTAAAPVSAVRPAAAPISQVVSAAAAVTPRAATDGDLLEVDDEVMEEDEYDAGGGDFAMSFGSSGASPVVSGGGWQGGAVSGEVGGGPQPPQPLYDEAAYADPAYGDPAYQGGYDPEGQTYVPDDPAAYAGYGQPAAPASAEPGYEEGDEDEDWSKLYPQAAGPDTIDAEADDIVDEATAIGGEYDPDKR
jgi:hypothetical protein